MSGLQEILVIVILVLLVFFIPRIMPRPRETNPTTPKTGISLKMRAGLAASVIYLTLASGYLRPWQKDLSLFVYAGIAPVAVIWLLVWVGRGKKSP